MDKQPVGQLPDLTQSNNDDEIMVITNDEYNQLKKEKISDFITDLTSTDADNSLVKGDDGKLFVSKTINASDVDGVLSLDNIPQLTTNKLPETGISADNYSYPSSITVNDRGQVVSIVEGSAAEAGAYLDQSQITNCILEIPQNIKYTLEDGVLTIKAGTIVTVPYGTTDQSSTYPVGATFINNNFKVVKTYFTNNKFFVQAEVQADIVSGGGGEPDGHGRTPIINLTSNVVANYLTDRQVSGDNPTVTLPYSGAYNKTTNRIGRSSNNSTIDYTTVYSFPLLQLVENETEKHGIVKQVFNGMGYIGATMFLLPRVKGLAPNGKNSDGTNNNIEYQVDYVYVETITNSSNNVFVLYFNADGSFADLGQGIGFSAGNSIADRPSGISYFYARNENRMYAAGSPSRFIVGGRYSFGETQITDFQFNTTFLAADDQTVLHKYGNETAYGDKTFNGSIIINAHTNTQPIQIMTDSNVLQSVCGVNTQVDYTALPSTVNGARVISYDKNGQYYGFFQTIAASGILRTLIGARRQVDGADKGATVEAVVDQNGYTYGTAPTYTANYADSSTKIVTTAYMANHWVTARATTSSTASKARPAVVVQNYVSGTSWYRVWSDGWIEQGGVVTAVADGNVTVTLLRTHANTNYSAVATQRDPTMNVKADAGTSIVPIANNQITIRNGNAGNIPICWRTAGY